MIQSPITKICLYPSVSETSNSLTYMVSGSERNYILHGFAIQTQKTLLVYYDQFLSKGSFTFMATLHESINNV